jgi:hypothetical protein
MNPEQIQEACRKTEDRTLFKNHIFAKQFCVRTTEKFWVHVKITLNPPALRNCSRMQSVK